MTIGLLQNLSAQVYPVQVVPTVISPYSSKLSDYSNAMVNRINLQVISTDVLMNRREVDLRVKIQGNGMSAQSRVLLTGVRPIYLNGGEIQSLSSSELATYFRYDNLEGISSTQYSNPLPDGVYTICFQVFDKLTQKVLSTSGCSTMYLMLNDPPLLNLPSNREEIASHDFPLVIFSWTPRQLNATNVSYRFELKELLDPTMDPTFAFEVSRPLYAEDDLRMTTLVYDINKPSLLPGKRYAWRVRAISTSGLGENSVFKNNGYSEVYSFTYSSSCSAPRFLLSEQQANNRVKIMWQGENSQQRYHVQYRKAGIQDAAWFDLYTVNTQSMLSNLEPGFTYEFRVGASCQQVSYGVEPSFTYSSIQTFRLEAKNNSTTYNCGFVPDLKVTNEQPLGGLVINETFMAGDFPVKVLDVSGSNGVFSGRGYIVVPYLFDTRIAVEFLNISINTDYQLMRGVVETTYDPTWKNVEFIDNLVDTNQQEITLPFPIADLPAGIQVGPGGDLVITGEDGRTETFPGGKDTVITDSTGQVYYVDKEGNVSGPTAVAEGGKPTPDNTDGVNKNGEVQAFTAKGISVAFESDDAFDAVAYNQGLTSDYKKIGGKYLPFKAVVKGSSTTVRAKVTLSDSQVPLDSLVFKTSAGTHIDAKRITGSNDFELTLTGTQSNAIEEVQASIKQGEKYKVAGAFKLVHLSTHTVNLRLVPTSDQVNLEGVLADLQAIYARVGVHVQVTVQPVFAIDAYVEGNQVETADEKDDLSTYSTAQQRIITAYQDAQTLDKAYYIFVTDKSSSTGQQGYMRLNGQFGFVFLGSTPSTISRTIAHELGHGAFKLEHPFRAFKSKGLREGATNSLMDYGTTSTDFIFTDWQQMNDPKLKLYAFQGQGDGEQNKFAHLGLTPTGQVFDAFYKDGSRINITVLLAKNYVIKTIEYDGLEYQWNASSRAFIRDHAKIEIKRVEKDLNDRVNLFRGRGDGCMYDYVTVVWDQEDEKAFNVQERIAEKIAVLKESDWTLSPLDIRDSSCGNLFIKELLARDLQDCNEVELNAGIVRLKEAIGLSDAKEVVRIVNQTCFAAIRNLSYNEIQTLIQRVASQTSIKEQSELAILRLMTAIKANDYMAFYRYLETNNNAVLKHLIAEMDDASIWFLTDKKNYTNFIGALVTMFTSNIASIADRWPTVEDDYAKRVINLNAIDYSSDVTSIFSPVFTSKHNIGTYDSTTGTIKLYDVYTTYTYGSVNAHNDGRHVQEHKDLVAEVSPLTPLIVIPKKGKLPLVATALGEPILDNNQYLVPAILLKYQEDKERNDYIEKGVVTTLDLATISLSGGVALSTKVNWVRRAWALAEVAGSVGNIAVNAQAVDSNSDLGKAIDIYNLAMGAIGVKNVAVGGYQFVRTLPDATKELLQKNASIRRELLTHYTEWKVLTTKLDDLSDVERQLIQQQEQVWKTLGVVDKLGNVVYKNIKYEDFIKTFAATEEQYKKAYQLWGEEKWSDLEKLFRDNNLNGGWPPFNGAKSILKTERGRQLANKVFDRFQGPGDISGEFASPVYGIQGIDDLYFTYDSRALKWTIGEGTNYIKFKFRSNVPDDVVFEYGDIVPWFGRQGLGDQIKSSKKLKDLIDDGIIEIIERKEFKEGQWK